MVSQFSIPVLLNLCSESLRAENFEILVKNSDTGGPSSISARIEYLFAFQFWYCELYVANRWGEAKSIVLLIFLLCSAIIVGGWGVVGWGRKSYLGPADMASFSCRELSWSNKHNTFWHVASPGYFYVFIFMSHCCFKFSSLRSI